VTGHLRSEDVVELAGCSYRQLSYWSSLGYLRPSRAHTDDPAASGNPFRWDATETGVAVRMAVLVNLFGMRPSIAAHLARDGWPT
jgi:hypothetical protein